MDSGAVRLARASSLPELQQPVHHEATVAVTVRDFLPQATCGHSLVRRTKFKAQRELLARSCGWGELEGLRAGIRSASTRLGVEDPQVQKALKMQSKAASFKGYCRDLYLQLRVSSIVQCMDDLVGKLYYHEQNLQLGPGLWEDPFLSWAREAVSLWMEEDNRAKLEDLSQQLRLGPGAFCEALASLALSTAPALLRAFGATLAEELPQLSDAGPELAAAIGRVLEKRPARPSVDAPGFETEFDQILRLSRLLGLLESQRLELLVMKQSSKGNTSLDVAARLSDNRCFCALTLPIFGETLVIKGGLQVQLAGTPCHAGVSPKRAAQSFDAPPLRRAGTKLCELLQLSPERYLEQLGIRLLQDGGVRVRLQGDLGHASAAEAQEAVGVGAVGTAAKAVGEMLRWEKALSLLKQVYAFPATCRSAMQASADADAQAAEAAASLAAVEQHTADCEAQIANTTARRDVMSASAKQQEESYMALMKQESEIQKKAMYGDDEAEEQLDKLKVHMQEEKKILNQMRQDLADLEQGVTDGSSNVEKARMLQDEAKAHLDAANAEAAEALAKSNDTAASYEALLHTSLVSMRK